MSVRSFSEYVDQTNFKHASSDTHYDTVLFDNGILNRYRYWILHKQVGDIFVISHQQTKADSNFLISMIRSWIGLLFVSWAEKVFIRFHWFRRGRCNRTHQRHLNPSAHDQSPAACRLVITDDTICALVVCNRTARSEEWRAAVWFGIPNSVSLPQRRSLTSIDLFGALRAIAATGTSKIAGILRFFCELEVTILTPAVFASLSDDSQSSCIMESLGQFVYLCASFSGACNCTRSILASGEIFTQTGRMPRLRSYA